MSKIPLAITLISAGVYAGPVASAISLGSLYFLFRREDINEEFDFRGFAFSTPICLTIVAVFSTLHFPAYSIILALIAVMMIITASMITEGKHGLRETLATALLFVAIISYTNDQNLMTPAVSLAFVGYLLGSHTPRTSRRESIPAIDAWRRIDGQPCRWTEEGWIVDPAHSRLGNRANTYHIRIGDLVFSRTDHSNQSPEWSILIDGTDRRSTFRINNTAVTNSLEEEFFRRAG